MKVAEYNVFECVINPVVVKVKYSHWNLDADGKRIVNPVVVSSDSLNKVIQASKLFFQYFYNFWSVEFNASITRAELILKESHKIYWKGYFDILCLSYCFWEVLTEEHFDVSRISVAVRLFVVSNSDLFFQISPLK